MSIILNGTAGVTFPDSVTQASGVPAPSTTGNVLTSNGTIWTSATNAPAFAAGTRMSFQQTAAPTGWTKDTTAAIDNSALRFVTGSVVNGGSVAFTTAFASQAVTGTNGASAAYTLQIADIPSHSHNWGGTSATGAGLGTAFYPAGTTANATSLTGGGGSHSHGAASFTGTAINLAVKYYDFIIASKN